ncbi:hypothetical protein GF318_06250 [Candidatus Micrarchaeota archaeon]|nr:hypothetical protein [Candidatus Micrarchaeota archaeon]
MGRVRILKRNGKAYVELPPGLPDCDELEIYPLKEGYYLISLPLGRAVTRPKKGLSENDRQVLRKLLSIRFEKRTPAYVSKALSEQEKQILRDLERRGHVNVFRGKKYRDGVYNINDKTYPLLKNRPPPSKPVQRNSDSFTLLKTQGYVVIPDRREAYSLSQKLKQDLKTGSVIGIRGFDGKFYAVTKQFLEKAEKAIAAALKEEMDISSIAETAKLNRDGCMAVLRIMAENGEVIEKKKGVFAPV